MTTNSNHTINAITLGHLKYGDSSLIVSCYTLQYGLQSYMLKGVLSKGQKKIPRSFFEPLTILELQAKKNPENRLGFIKEAKVGYPFKSIPYDLNKKSLVFFLSEIIYQVAREEQSSNPLLYNYIYEKIIWLDENQNVGLFHIKMMLDLTKYIGFYPNISNQKAPYFDLESGCMALSKPKDNYIEDPIKTYWLNILGIEFDKILEIQIIKNYKLEILNSVIRYFELHLQQFKPPKSKKVLNEIFKTI